MNHFAICFFFFWAMLLLQCTKETVLHKGFEPFPHGLRNVTCHFSGTSPGGTLIIKGATINGSKIITAFYPNNYDSRTELVELYFGVGNLTMVDATITASAVFVSANVISMDESSVVNASAFGLEYRPAWMWGHSDTNLPIQMGPNHRGSGGSDSCTTSAAGKKPWKACTCSTKAPQEEGAFKRAMQHSTDGALHSTDNQVTSICLEMQEGRKHEEQRYAKSMCHTPCALHHAPYSMRLTACALQHAIIQHAPYTIHHTACTI
jgi:hypothetical protein